MAKRSASPQQILEIRTQADAGVLNVKAWADALQCSIETIRRYARRDTARELDWSPRDEYQVRGPEPSEADIMASIQRLQAASATVSKQSVDSLLGELTHKGADGAHKT